MTNQSYEPWTPIPSTPFRVTVEGVEDLEDGLVIHLRNAERSAESLCLRFTGCIAYRNIDESFRLKTWGELESDQVPSLLIVRNSAWIAWLTEESGRVLEEFDLTHYAIFTSDDCIDVVTTSVPIVDRRYVEEGA